VAGVDLAAADAGLRVLVGAGGRHGVVRAVARQRGRGVQEEGDVPVHAVADPGRLGDGAAVEVGELAQGLDGRDAGVQVGVVERVQEHRGTVPAPARDGRLVLLDQARDAQRLGELVDALVGRIPLGLRGQRAEALERVELLELLGQVDVVVGLDEPDGAREVVVAPGVGVGLAELADAHRLDRGEDLLHGREQEPRGRRERRQLVLERQRLDHLLHAGVVVGGERPHHARPVPRRAGGVELVVAQDVGRRRGVARLLELGRELVADVGDGEPLGRL
jgi:hypothetical protein